MLNIVQSCIGTKFTNRFGSLMAVITCFKGFNWFAFKLDFHSFFVSFSRSSPLMQLPLFRKMSARGEKKLI